MDFLTPGELQCLAMYYYDGMRQRKIAKAIGMSQPTVSRLLESGRTKLAERGMNPKRIELVDPPTCKTMDPSQMDRLGPDDVKAVW
jgi:predicted DNA-binding protein (UPF0251 family)